MKFGIIGGSGLYQIEGLENVKFVKAETPFGPPSDELILGTLGGADIVFLPRHGRNHTILPGELNHKANIYAMKQCGVTHILSISAVGSLRESMAPRDVVVVDQYFDRTKKGLEHTFFGGGIVAHTALANPACPELSELTAQAAETALKALCPGDGAPKVHRGGTYVNMEGPAFSTKAESMTYRSSGFDVIGMTNLGEAKLAREAEICYCTAAMVTDYDCWHPDHDHVTVEMIIANFSANVTLAKRIISEAVKLRGSLKGKCACPSALAGAIITKPEAVSNELRKKLAPIIGKYLPVK